MEGILKPILLLLVVVFVIALWGTIFVKAGYRGWWSVLMGVLMLTPAALIVMLVLAEREWPIHREMRDLRIRCGCGTEEDAYSLIKEGNRLDAQGKYDDALLKLLC